MGGCTILQTTQVKQGVDEAYRAHTHTVKKYLFYFKLILNLTERGHICPPPRSDTDTVRPIHLCETDLHTN